MVGSPGLWTRPWQCQQQVRGWRAGWWWWERSTAGGADIAATGRQDPLTPVSQVAGDMPSRACEREHPQWARGRRVDGMEMGI